MVNNFQRLLLLFLLLISNSLAWATDSFRSDCDQLTKNPHRLSGSLYDHQAARYVKSRLEEIGVDKVIDQEFAVAQTEIIECYAENQAGQVLDLLPMRPNNIVMPVTPAQGIGGQVVYLGKATFNDLSTKSVENKIALIDYNCQENWLRVLRLGAKAVIFVRNNQKLLAGNFHYNFANANIPRYFYDGPLINLTNQNYLTIFCAQRWQRKIAHNIFGLIKGRKARFGLDKDEIVVLSAGLDSFGEVPTLSPGARGAANCAALLSITEAFVTNRPERDVLVAFFDGECRGYSGACNFYMALEDKVKDHKIQDRIKFWTNETNFLNQTVALLDNANPFDIENGAVKREFINRLHEITQGHASSLKEALKLLRKNKYQLTLSNQVLIIDQEITAKELLKDQWNNLRRNFDQGQINPLYLPLFTNVLAQLKVDLNRRMIELKDENRFLKSALEIQQLMLERQIVIHSSLLLDDNSKLWTVLLGGESDMNSVEDKTGLYNKILKAFRKSYRSLSQQNLITNFEPTSVDGTLDESRLLWNAPLLIRSCEVAGRYGFFNVTLGSCYGKLEYEGTPDDTLANLDLSIIEKNATEIGLMLRSVCQSDGLSLRQSISTRFSQIMPSMNESGRSTGPVVMGRRPGSSMPSKPMGDVVFQLFHSPSFEHYYNTINKGYAFDPFIVLMTDQNGAYGPVSWYGSWPNMPLAFAAGFDQRGCVDKVSDTDALTTFSLRMNMFNCQPMVVMLPPLFSPKIVKFLNARGNSKLARSESFTGTQDGIGYCYFEKKIKALKAFDPASLVILNNSPEVVEDIPQPEYGIGLPVAGGSWLGLKCAEQSANDLWRLNESRLVIMRERNIINSSLEELHSRVKDLLNQAENCDNPLKREALAASAFMTSKPVYKTILSGLDDLVKAALILLALCIPFAFALERLLIGSSIIYKQAIWFVSFFILTFIILYFSHPAFAIAKSPIIVFLGFGVVTLATLVIIIMMQRFETELKALQGMQTSVHSVDVSRVSTIMAAMAMGMSTMRRRPLRTTLTAVTIILLTFTLLCFASFDLQTGIVKLMIAPAPRYTGVLIHKPDWRSYNAEFFDVIKGRWNDQTSICPRVWVCPFRNDFPDFVIANADGHNPFKMKGILGISKAELACRDDLKALFPIEPNQNFDDLVFITEPVAKELNVAAGDQVFVKGKLMTIGKLLNSTFFSAMSDMDGNSILPIDFVEMKSEELPTSSETADPELSGDLLEEQKSWTRIAPNAVVVMSTKNAKALGARLHSATIYTADVDMATSIATDIARMLDKIPVIATLKDGTYRLVHTTVMAASGIGDLLFPLILGGLVVFGTMLSSVADREKEIYTFSALGLAPPHVASLFFAEAMVYSVLGGLGGYLIAQISMKMMEIAANYGLLTMPEMNYSSINAIVTILIVMATVLISSIYPAIKASKSANPGLMRSWKIPPPRGDELKLTFPFTVSEYDLTGIVSFLKEHFDNFNDSGIGCFMAQNSDLVVKQNGALGLKSKIALAPFDLGVTQLFELESTPSEIPGIDEIVLTINRISGQPKDWMRLNKVMLDNLRKQFLVWRSLPLESMQIYRHRTLTAINK